MAEIGLDDYDRDEDYDPDPDDWYDDDYREPDPEDAEIARAYEEHYEHCETVHGGGDCNCRPSLRERVTWRVQAAGRWLRGTWYRVRYAARQPWTVYVGRAEITVRLRPRECGACGGRGWFYSKTGIDPMPMPPGYDGVSLCGCGTAIGKLADARRAVRRTRNDKTPPF